MGVERVVDFPAGPPPAWPEILARLAASGEAPVLRMIDGLPAFPDESPEDGWRELRVGFPAGMVTLRRGTDTLTCVVWSNADPALVAARDRVAWACAAAGPGAVATPAGEVPADEFARLAGLSPV